MWFKYYPKTYSVRAQIPILKGDFSQRKFSLCIIRPSALNNHHYLLKTFCKNSPFGRFLASQFCEFYHLLEIGF